MPFDGKGFVIGDEAAIIGDDALSILRGARVRLTPRGAWTMGESVRLRKHRGPSYCVLGALTAEINLSARGRPVLALGVKYWPPEGRAAHKYIERVIGRNGDMAVWMWNDKLDFRYPLFPCFFGQRAVLRVLDKAIHLAEVDLESALVAA